MIDDCGSWRLLSGSGWLPSGAGLRRMFRSLAGDRFRDLGAVRLCAGCCGLLREESRLSLHLGVSMVGGAGRKRSLFSGLYLWFASAQYSKLGLE
jgi:hypothetical protein